MRSSSTSSSALSPEKDRVTAVWRFNRVLASAIASTLVRLPRLEQVVAVQTDARRLQIALTRVRRRGVRIATVYDIGAHRGDWTQSIRPHLPGATFLLFEASEAHEGWLEKTGDRYFIVVLSSEEKLVDFYATGGSGDSYYREATPNYDGVEPRRVPATTLDRMIERNGLRGPDFIKADVQGAEIDVLRGGRRALAHARLVLLECPIVEYNVGAPRIDEYFRFMN